MQLIATLSTIATTMVGLTLAAPALEAAGAIAARQGQCGVHVTQWQKNQNGVGGDYQYDVRIYDSLGRTVGGDDRVAIPDLGSHNFPLDGQSTPLVITSGTVDSDPISFTYGGDQWLSSSRCSVGAYDSGNRDMDCGFGC